MPMQESPLPHDAVIIGGSYAGLSAGLQLARARRRVLVIDDGRPRNRFASHAHGVLANDGRPGRDITDDARRQIMAYPTAVIRQGEAVSVERSGRGFSIAMADGATVEGRRVLLAHGVEDAPPAIPGVKERWGQTAIHCPWCHGYEIDRGPIGVLSQGEHTTHYALMVAEWGEPTLFLDPAVQLSAEETRMLGLRGVAIERTPIAALEGAAPLLDGARLADGRFIPLKAIFVGSHVRLGNSFAEHLGCEMTDTPVGRLVKVDPMQQTSQPGVFAAGDLARAASNITYAASDGMTAAHGLFRSLLEEELA
ncbi:NAD(P)/FAD-dependent oxidoreductase [Brevundimonas sp.]|uniref:NAD(P)/FAD-dependent oxidoreductase n=1 Tax=Brevundimonas sp. TaxID=1871086 RepID=UPI0025C308B4|nr:NAD(P)/FAD-dependent oxidoreductase [Brevundimonas sp.]